MSALEALWLWLQGRSSRTETGPDTTDIADNAQQPVAPAVNEEKRREDAARIQRHARYRAGPWQMK